MDLHLNIIILLLISLISKTTAYVPPAQGWVSFCDDIYCSENCGMWLNINNPGCVNQVGRKSFWLDGRVKFNNFALIVSPRAGCPCQTKCMDGMSGDQDRCVVLDESIKGDSYRFITGSCPENTKCPWKRSFFELADVNETEEESYKPVHFDELDGD